MQEVWKDINGYEGYYQISNFGRVRSLDREILYSDGRCYHYNGKILKFGNCKGYHFVNLYKDTNKKIYRVCRLVAIHFIDNPHNLPQVNHKDENTENDHASNLEWCDMEYNNSYGTHIKRVQETAEKNRRAFVCIETGKVYRNIKACAKELRLLPTGINNVLKHRAHRHGGYHFRYIDEEVV